MKVTLYKSAICPRCYMAKKYLEELATTFQELTIETVDILSEPKRTIQDGIRMIPTLKINDRTLSGLYLKKETIASFLTENQYR